MKCREYQGAKIEGYGVRWNRQRGKNEFLHRWVVAQVHGWEAVEGKIVMHSCDNPPCFLYEHLSIGTIAENNADRDAKGRQRGPKGEHWKKLTSEQVKIIRDRHSAGETQVSLGREFGVHSSTVSYLVRGKTWKECDPN